jgi:LuxR family transcriptional regulator, maltose regulon positive regulatory protein
MSAVEETPLCADAKSPSRFELFRGLPIVPSKLVIPKLPHDFTPRPRVASAIRREDNVICFVQAPAGYGKTTAAVEALAARDRGDVAWLSIDAYDSTELSFWAHLTASIDIVRPGVLSFFAAANRRTPKQGSVQLAASLLAALPPDDELLIVFDDLHHLKSKNLWEQVAFFVERLPPGVRILATTRSRTPLPVERWQSQGKAVVVDEQTLRFDTTEAASLIDGITQREVTAHEVAELVVRSEGWAVGLLLEALTAHRIGPDGPASELRPKPTRTVVNYLATEVLDTLSADDRNFLLSISVLDEFDDDLCRRITGENDAGIRLRSLQLANLFLVPVGEESGRLRFHHLFRELLLEELEKRDPGRRIELHRRAAEAACANGQVLVQIHHLVEAGDKVDAFDLMVAHAWAQGSLATAREVIDSFPSDFVNEDPRRMMHFALVHAYAGNWEMEEQLCDQVEATLTDESGMLRAHLELHRVWRYAGHGDAEAGLAALQCSLAAGAREDDSLGSLALMSGARIHVFLTRDRQAATCWLDEGRRLPPDRAIVHHITIPALSSFLQLWDGDTHEAERLARHALAASDQFQKPAASLPILESLIALSDVFLETARLVDAASTLERADALAGQLAPPAYLTHVALRQIDLAAATHGPSAGCDAAARARTALKGQRLGVALTDALNAKHAYWLLADGRTIDAARLTDSLKPSPLRCILRAKLRWLDHGCGSLAEIIGDTRDWSAAERFEGELICDAAEGYRRLPDIIQGAEGFIWTAVKQGQPLLRRLTSLAHAPVGVIDLLDKVGAFDTSFRPTEVGGAGGPLTDREQALLQLLSSHLSYAEMAAELYISVNTVKANLKSLYRKLGASSRSEAVQRARVPEMS